MLAAPVLKEGEETAIEELLDQFILINVDAQIADVAARIREKAVERVETSAYTSTIALARKESTRPANLSKITVVSVAVP